LSSRTLKSLGLLIVHGMGVTTPDFHRELTDPLVRRLKGDWDRIAWQPVYYQDALQGNQKLVLERMKPRIRWEGLRELMLFGFSDAASLEHKKEEDDKPYFRSQSIILDALDAIFDEAGGAIPLAIVAQSLGGQVTSNYIWDAQQAPHAYAGVWRAPPSDAPSGSPRDVFRRCGTLQRLLTTGCNIPVFVAGHRDIMPIDRALLGEQFRWVNLFDPDDVLGWPLRELSPGYRELVEDVEVNASGRSLLGAFKSLTPGSHTQYWRTNSVLDRIEAELRTLLLFESRIETREP
jgi:hypothetical protein